MTDSLLDEAINLATARTPDEVDRSTVALTADALLRVLLDNEVIVQLRMDRPCPSDAHDGDGGERCRGCGGTGRVGVTGDFLRAALRLPDATG